MVIVKATKGGFSILAVGTDANQFVLSIETGYMSDGSRFVERDALTEELLVELEGRFSVEIWA